MKSFFCISILVLILGSCKEVEGPEGLTSLISISPEPAGISCFNGGQKIDAGIDINRNGELDTNEIQETSFLCNGNHGLNSIVKSFPESVGENCSAGGVKVISGLDINSDKELDENEIQRTEFICNGIGGVIDSQIILRVGGFVGSNDQIPWVGPGELMLFDKSFYPGIDSAIFVVFDIKTSDYVGNDISGPGTFQLFDITHNKVIDNTTIVSDDIPANTFIKSPNIVNNLPNEAANYGIRVFSGGDYSVQCGNVYLILYRKLE